MENQVSRSNTGLLLLRYLCVGGISTAIDYTIFMLSVGYVQIVFATIISSTFAMIFSFFAHGLFTFRQGGSTRRVIPFVFSNVLSFWLIQPLVIFLLMWLGGDLSFAKVSAFILGIIINFVLYRFWVWPARDTPKR